MNILEVMTYCITVFYMGYYGASCICCLKFLSFVLAKVG